MSLFKEDVFDTHIATLLFDTVFSNNLKDKKFFVSQLELSEDDEKFLLSAYQCEIKISENENFYFYLVDGKETSQPFHLLFLGSDIEKLFLAFIDLESEEGIINCRTIKGLQSQLFWASCSLEQELELALFLIKIDHQGHILHPTKYKTQELLSLAQNYLVNILNR